VSTLVATASGIVYRGGQRRGYYQRGVRRIGEDVYSSIIARAEASEDIDRVPTSRGEVARGALYASSAVGQLVETYSRKVALESLEAHHPSAAIREMPRNNPGYDIRVEDTTPIFVEVKGTQAQRPRFLLSEGERCFAAAHADAYVLIVVFGIDLDRETHLGLESRYGDVAEHAVLVPIQWSGRLAAADPRGAPPS